MMEDIKQPRKAKKQVKRNWKQAKRESKIIIGTIVLCTVIVSFLILLDENKQLQEQLNAPAPYLEDVCEALDPVVLPIEEENKWKEDSGEYVKFTAYNTVEEQTDSTPCIAANGYICGRNDVIACPRDIPLGTKVELEGYGIFECMDRMHDKYDCSDGVCEEERWDISFDKDIEGAIQWGHKNVKVEVIS